MPSNPLELTLCGILLKNPVIAASGTFGFGHDLYVPQNLTNGGSSFLYTYNYRGQPSTGVSLLDGSIWHGNDVTFGAIQVFAISAVPEPTAVTRPVEETVATDVLLDAHFTD